MSEDRYLVRTPLLDPQQRIDGYKLAWQKKENSIGLLGDRALHRLLALFAEHGSGPSLGPVFLNAMLAEMSAAALQDIAPAWTVLVLGRTDLVEGIDLTAAQSLRERGFRLARCDAMPTLGFLNQMRVCVRC
jgi:hypothetical protein